MTSKLDSFFNDFMRKNSDPTSICLCKKLKANLNILSATYLDDLAGMLIFLGASDDEMDDILEEESEKISKIISSYCFT